MELDLCKEGPWVLTTKNCGIAQEPSLFQCDFLSHWVLKSIERKAFIMFRVKKLESGYKLGSGSKLGQILDSDQNTIQYNTIQSGSCRDHWQDPVMSLLTG